MKKRLLSTLLTLCMVLALLPVTTLASTHVTVTQPTRRPSGEQSDNTTPAASEQSDNTTSAADSDFVIENGVLKKYNGPGGDVTIPDSVTVIGEDAFYSCRSLTSVTIPNSVTSIGDSAFDGCSSLISVTIPKGVTSIGYKVFTWCDSLTSIDVTGGNPAYSSVDGVLFSADQTHLYTFPAGKSDLSYSIPESVTTIGTGAFNGSNLTSVTIPDGVASIEEDAFYWCSSLTSVTIPVSVTTIGYRSFGWCENLTDVYYAGSESQWEQIDHQTTEESFYSSDLNYLYVATIHYNSTSASSAPSTPSGISVTVDGIAVTWADAAPFIDANSRTMVPLRAVADAMGLDVNWDGSAREAVFTNGSKTIYFPIDSNTARTSNGGAVQMDTAAVIVNDRTYAPIRYLAEYFGYEVGWDAATRTVTIK